MNVSIPKNNQDDRFVILKMKDKNVFVVDMETQKNVALPDQIKSKTTKEILNWLETQG